MTDEARKKDNVLVKQIEKTKEILDGLNNAEMGMSICWGARKTIVIDCETQEKLVPIFEAELERLEKEFEAL